MLALVCCAFCANLAVLPVVGSYDARLGPFHFVAHRLFKPCLLMGGAFWIALLSRRLVAGPPPTATDSRKLPWPFPAFAIAAYLAIYLSSLPINAADQAWVLSDASAALRTLGDFPRLFIAAQPDGFYRPFTFVSLRLDFALFHSELWAYHLQNIVLHALNALLIYRLARKLTFASMSAFWAAAWFLLAAVNFEPVLWPAARFDLLAAFFTLLSLLWFLRYIHGPHGRTLHLCVSLFAYALALLNKESAYCVPLLLCGIVFTNKRWFGVKPPRPKVVRAAYVFGGLTAVMLAVRIVIYNGLGGYPTAIHGGASPHFVFTFKTITGLVTRVIPIPLLGINTSVPLGAWLAYAIAVYAATMAWAVVRGASAGKKELTLLAFGILSALPALNLTGWVGGSMQHARYLYLPGLWIVMAAALAISRLRFGSVALALIVAANLAGAAHNLNVYRSMFGRARVLAQQIARDCSHYHAETVDLSGIENEPFGVFFFRSEIVKTLQAARPSVCVALTSHACDSAKKTLRYEWLPDSVSIVPHNPVP